MKFPEPSFQIVPNGNFALFVALFFEAQNALFAEIAQVDRFRSSRRGVQADCQQDSYVKRLMEE